MLYTLLLFYLPPFEGHGGWTTIDFKDFPRKGSQGALKELVRLTEIGFAGLV